MAESNYNLPFTFGELVRLPSYFTELIELKWPTEMGPINQTDAYEIQMFINHTSHVRICSNGDDVNYYKIYYSIETYDGHKRLGCHIPRPSRENQVTGLPLTAP